jgi:lipopolysaccharide/colanic/teichoic acid biosynthesis glycosyltransferase
MAASSIAPRGRSRLAVEYFPNVEGVFSVPMPAWKRWMDVVGAIVGLIVLSPVFVAVSLAIMLDDFGPAFYRQRRVGHGGRVFTCLKFRSMCQGADRMLTVLAAQNEADGHIFKMKDDPRRTRVGRFVRRTSLDELPQLINVLRGEMSLVGPRPPTIGEVANYNERELGRLAATPGLTGLWQVTLRRERHDLGDMVELDTRYAATMSPWLDVSILLRTIPTVLGGKGSF